MIVVFTMGRVGSTNVWRAIKASGLEAFHIHSLHRPSLEKQMAKNAPRSAKEALAVLDGMKALKSGQRVKVVTLTRHATGRNVSAAFAQYEKVYGYAEIVPEVAVEIWNSFFKKRPFQWFEREYGELGIDPYSLPFEDGHVLISQGSIDALIMNCELPDRLKNELLGAFLGTKIDVKRRRRKSPSAARYAAFKAALPLEVEMRHDRDSRFMRHFYGHTDPSGLP